MKNKKEIFKKVLKSDYNYLTKIDNFKILDEYKYTLLDYSILNNDIEMFSYLLDKVDINNINIFGENSLFLAIKKKNILIIDLLIKNNIDINLKNLKGETPLLIASKLGDLNIINLLVNNKANINDKNINNQNAFHYYLMGGNFKYLEELIKLFNINYDLKDYENNTLVHYACKYSNSLVLSFFIKKNININLLNNNNEIALFKAFEFKNIENIKILLKYENFINVKNRQGLDIKTYLNEYEYEKEYLELLNDYIEKKENITKKYKLIEDVLNNDCLKLENDLKTYLSVKDRYNLDEYDYACLYKNKKIIKLISDYRKKTRKY